MSKVPTGQPRVVFGVDVLPQSSPLARGEPRYALVVLRDGEVIWRDPEVSRPELMRLVEKETPDVVAVDNIWELAADVNALKAMVERLPTKTRILQVTGPPEASLPLQEAAKRHGIAPPPGLIPLKEAEATARLGELGVGAKVEVLENETRVLVRRGVSLGPGGSSQARYRRNIHSVILAYTKRIRDRLDKLKLDYDLQSEESDHGLERAEFTVYARRDLLRGVIKPVLGGYVRVEVNPVFRKQVIFTPRDSETEAGSGMRSTRKLIVGVDPGTTCGLAVLSFAGEPLLITSRRGLTRGDITRMLFDLGEPAVVAADVTPAPEFAEKLAKSLNSFLFTPKALPEATEKQQIASEYSIKHGITFEDPHERDALAAAVKSHQHFKNKFEQVESHIRETGAKVPLEECQALVVKGRSIKEAIAQLTPKPSLRRETPQPQPSESPWDLVERLKLRIEDREREIARLERINESLTQEIRALETNLEGLKEALERVRSAEAGEIRRNREVQTLRREVKSLQAQTTRSQAEAEEYRARLEKLRRIRELESRGEAVFLKPVESFTENGLSKSFELYDIERGDAVFLLNASGGGAAAASELGRRGIRVVVAGTPMSQQAEDMFNKLDIPIIDARKIEIVWAEGYPYIRSELLEEAIKRARRTRAEEEVRGIEELVKEYREERGQRE